jgi:hypothetical protein
VQLWNAAERIEPRANGRLATELELALPHELTDAQRKRLVMDFLAPIIARHGVAADVAIHAPGEDGDHRNIHAHVLLTHRELGPEGFGEIANRRTITKKVKGQEKQIEVAGIAATPADIKAIRKNWEQQVNRAYERAGLDVRVDHRSHEDRGIEDKPSKHLGPTAAAIERKGIASERGDLNRGIAQRNVDRRALKALDAEARKIAAEIIVLEAGRTAADQRQAATGRYDEVRVTQRDTVETERRAATETAHAFPSAADRVTEPGMDVPPGSPENRPEPGMRPLGKTAADIRAAWTLSRSAEQLEDALASRGITLAEVSAEEARQSQRTAAFVKEVGNFARVLKEGEIVAVTARGNHRLDARTTGDAHPDIEARFPGLDRAGLLSVTVTKEAMQEAARATWRSEQQIEREKARPANWIGSRIAECAQQARISGANIVQDAEGRHVSKVEALADRLKPDDERQMQTAAVYGREAFAARLEDAGIVIVRATDADRLALDALQHDENMKRLAAETNREAYKGNHFAALETGDLAAVTRNGDV